MPLSSNEWLISFPGKRIGMSDWLQCLLCLPDPGGRVRMQWKIHLKRGSPSLSLYSALGGPRTCACL